MGSSTSKGTQTLVYASVLYWREHELPLVERCVASLAGQHLDPFLDFKLLVVDNGCGLTPRLPEGPNIELIRLAHNRGFAGGHNAAMQRALANGADYVFLLNSDAVAEPACIQELVRAAEAEPSAAFVGPVIIRADDRDHVESAGQSFSPRTARHRELARGQTSDNWGDKPVRVDAISGCAMLASRSAIEALGMLDEDLFVYFEDMDWCLRAREAGSAVLVAPRARVAHIGQGSMGAASPLTTFYSVRNHMVVASRHGGRLRGPLLKSLVLGYHLAFITRSRPRRNVRHLSAVARGAWSAWVGRLGAHP